MDELIDIADEQGALLGQTELKSIIHQKGYYHHTAHIWFILKMVIFYYPNVQLKKQYVL